MKEIGNSDDFIIQKEIGESSWFGFSLILKPGSRFTRYEVLSLFKEHGVETRPIVAGNFAKNDVMKYIHHEIFETLANADYLHDNGLYIGNHHYDVSDKIRAVKEIVTI